MPAPANAIFKMTAKGVPEPLLALNLEHAEQRFATFEVNVRMDTAQLQGSTDEQARTLLAML